MDVYTMCCKRWERESEPTEKEVMNELMSGSHGMIIKSPGNGIRGGASSMCKGIVRVQDISLRHQCIWRKWGKTWVGLEGSGCSEQVGLEVKNKTWGQIAHSFVGHTQEFDFTLCKIIF